MSRKLIFLGLLFMLLAPGAALSLGLGEIQLNSHLNQRMDAQIALSVGSPAELDTLRVGLAPSETFRRFGLDRPAFFDELRFEVVSTGATAAVVRVTSTRPVTEPFLTFLIEARWSGGQILREYTVLLDPPTFLPTPEAAPAPVPAPAAPAARPPATEPQPAPVTRPAPAAEPVAAPTPARPEYDTEFGPVQRNDTLWRIAQRVRPDPALTTNQVMVALFRANPQAFDGNINRLRAGTILRVPSRAAMAATSTAEASTEVRRQNEAWRTPATPARAAVPVERRLELAPPTETETPAAPPAADPVRDTPAVSPELLEAVQQLRGELAETRRLMEVKDSEIAALQSRLAELETEGAAVPSPTPDEPAVATPAPGDADVATPAPAPAPVEAVTPAPAPAPVAPVAPAPTLLDRAMALLSSAWLWLLLAVLLVVAAIVVFLRKRSDESARSIEDDLAATGNWDSLEALAADTGPDGKSAGKSAAAGGAAAVAAASTKAKPAVGQADDLDSILVEEAAQPGRAASASKSESVVAPVPELAPQPPESAEEADYQYPFEDTIAGETSINLDQTDPLAEADFHMAYGLYDQAAEIIKKAIEREPDRYDLRRKLIDICFVWGNAEEFLSQARQIRELGGEQQAADWAKIGIMGRQICPGEPLFAATEDASLDVDFSTEDVQSSGAGAGAGAAASAAAGAAAGATGEWLDFDVGESDEGGDALGDTREQPVPLATDQTAEINLEDLDIDIDIDIDLDESGGRALADFEALPGDPDDDDDGGTLMMDVSAAPTRGDDPTQRGEGPRLSGEDPTLSGLSGITAGDFVDDDFLRDDRADAEDADGDDDPTMTGLGPIDIGDDEDPDKTQIRQFEPPEELSEIDVSGLADDPDLDLDDLTQMLESDLELADGDDDDDATRLAPGPAEDDMRFFKGAEDDDATLLAPGLAPEPDSDSDYELGDTRAMAADSINEIATKLDLARAYVDMGDPDGARSILEEVVEEGDEAQREEARQLLDSLG